MNPGASQHPQFYISNKKFCATRLDQCMALDTAEEWTITNYTDVSHPFHIHINPFFVTHFFDANDYFSEQDAACLGACATTAAACAMACTPGDAACVRACDDARANCAADCPRIHDPSEALPPDAGLLAPLDPMRRWQDTIGLPHAYIPPLRPPADRCSDPFDDQASAEVGCPATCAAQDAQWNAGAWSCDAAAVDAAGCDTATSCVCSCAPNPAPIRHGFVKVRQRFLDHAGDFVIHCHILGHEDRGMMHRIGVRDSLQACEAAELEIDGADCPQGASVCTETCQSSEVDLSQPLPDICQSFAPDAQGGGWARNCLYDR
jgi:hypothetical protein